MVEEGPKGMGRRIFISGMRELDRRGLRARSIRMALQHGRGGACARRQGQVPLTLLSARFAFLCSAC
jgi:hypothetical protein